MPQCTRRASTAVPSPRVVGTIALVAATFGAIVLIAEAVG